MITRKVRHKNEDGTVVDADIGALAKNVEEDEQHRFTSDEEKKKWNWGTKLIMVSLPASGWTENDAGLFTQTVSIEDLKETDSAVMHGYMAPNISENDSETYWENYGKISGGQAADGSMTFYAAENPGSDLMVYLSMGKSGDGRLILSGGSAGGEAGTGVSNVIITLTDNAAVAEGGAVTAACNGKTWQSTIKNGRAKLYTSEVGTYTITVKTTNEAGEEVTYTTMLACTYFGQFSTDIYSGTLAVTCTEEGGNGKTCNVRSCDDEYNPTNAYNLTQTFDSTLKLTFLGIPAGKYLVTVDDKYVFFKEITSIQNINSVEVELKQWLYRDGDECLHNTGGWMETLNGGEVEHVFLCTGGNGELVMTWGGSYSANVTFGSRSMTLYAKASSSQVFGYQKYGRDQVDAKTSVGIVNNTLDLKKYTRCNVSASQPVSITARTGAENNGSTFLNTATVVASGNSPISVNADTAGTIVIGKTITTNSVSGQSTACGNATAEYTSEITQVWLE